MSTPAPVGYLDAIFTAIRAFTANLSQSQQWLARAETTRDRAWRLSFLHAARRAYEAAHPLLADLRRQLGPPGDERVISRPDDLMSPLDQLQQNLVAMHQDFLEHERRLLSLEAELAFALGPVGTA